MTLGIDVSPLFSEMVMVKSPWGEGPSELQLLVNCRALGSWVFIGGLQVLGFRARG